MYKLPLYGELGRYPLYIDTIMSMIKYWIRLYNNETKDALLKEGFSENLVMVNSNQQCWLRCIKIILDGCSLSYLYDNPQSIKDKTLSIIIQKKLKSKFFQNWSQQLDKSEKMRTYKLFKDIFCFEKYLYILNDNVKDRVSLTRFRTSTHKLQIEVGRYTVPKTHIN